MMCACVREREKDRGMKRTTLGYCSIAGKLNREPLNRKGSYCNNYHIQCHLSAVIYIVHSTHTNTFIYCVCILKISNKDLMCNSDE